MTRALIGLVVGACLFFLGLFLGRKRVETASPAVVEMARRNVFDADKEAEEVKKHAAGESLAQYLRRTFGADK